MKKLKSIPVYFLLIVLCSNFISSCSEDPVTPPPPEQSYEYDSARFDWKVDTLGGYYSPISISCVNTKDIYFLDIYRTLIHYDGENFTTHLLPFSVLGTSLKAYNDKVFIGGLYLNPLKYDRPALLIKEGNMFSEIQLPDSNQKYYINSIERTANDVIWLGTNNGKLLKYEADNFKFFQFDSIYFVDVFKDINENIYIVNRREFYDSVGNNGKKYIEINKYENGSFKRLYYKYFEPIDDFTLATSIIGGEIYARNSFSIFKFNGCDFVKIIDLPDFYPSLIFAGKSESDINLEGIIRPYAGSTFLFNWNGLKWSKELKVNVNSFGIIQKINDTYVYIGILDPYETYMIIGKEIQ